MPSFTAPELYAYAHERFCDGEDRCHWCGAACRRQWRHDDAPPIIGVKNYLARCPANHFICIGCWLFRRRRATVRLAGGGFSDGHKATDVGWLLTPGGALAVRRHDRQDGAALYKTLLKPPDTFCLTLLAEAPVVHLQLAAVNDVRDLRADTPLTFSIDNKHLTYTVYELEEALRGEPEGKSPGVQALLRLLGPCDLIVPREEEPPRGRGRPRNEDRPVANPARRPLKDE